MKRLPTVVNVRTKTVVPATSNKIQTKVGMKRNCPMKKLTIIGGD